MLQNINCLPLKIILTKFENNVRTKKYKYVALSVQYDPRSWQDELLEKDMCKTNYETKVNKPIHS